MSTERPACSVRATARRRRWAFGRAGCTREYATGMISPRDASNLRGGNVKNLRSSDLGGLGVKGRNQSNNRHLARIGIGHLGVRVRKPVRSHHGGHHEQCKRRKGMCLVRNRVPAEPWWVKFQSKREMRLLPRFLSPRRNAGGFDSLPPHYFNSDGLPNWH